MGDVSTAFKSRRACCHSLSWLRFSNRRWNCGSSATDRLSVRTFSSIFPVSDTSFRCFLIRMDPLSVQRVLRGAGSSPHCPCGGWACFFSLTQMSISAKRKHSSSCHDTLSLPTRSVPESRSLPNLALCVSVCRISDNQLSPRRFALTG